MLFIGKPKERSKTISNCVAVVKNDWSFRLLTLSLSHTHTLSLSLSVKLNKSPTIHTGLWCRDFHAADSCSVIVCVNGECNVCGESFVCREWKSTNTHTGFWSRDFHVEDLCSVIVCLNGECNVSGEGIICRESKGTNTHTGFLSYDFHVASSCSFIVCVTLCTWHSALGERVSNSPHAEQRMTLSTWTCAIDKAFKSQSW